MKLPTIMQARRPLLIAVLLVAFYLRTFCLECQSLWLDEAASAYWTAIPLGEFFLDTADNLHVPGYFLLLRGWASLTGLSAFSLRYLSVLTGLFLIPLASWFGRRLLRDDGTALLAAAIAAVSAAHVYYSQETRMYAAMPVLYLGMLALVISIMSRPRHTYWLMLVALELAALYFHLFAALMVLTINLLFLAYDASFRPSNFRRRWLGSQLVVILLLLPWLLFTWGSGGALPANLGDTTQGAARFELGNYLAQIWTFLLTGLTTRLSHWSYWALLLFIAFCIAVPVIYMRSQWPQRRGLLVLLAGLIVPFLAGAAIWSFNPLTHPRYLFFLMGPLILLLAHTIARLFSRRNLSPLAAALLLLILLLDFSAWRAAQLDSSQRRYDAASLAAAIARRGDRHDVALMPPYDRSLWYYNPSPVVGANWPFAGGDQSARAERLGELLNGYDGAFLIEYHDLYSYDPNAHLSYFLESNGRLVEKFTVDRMDVSYYALSHSQPAPMTEVNARCDNLTLTGASFPSQVLPGDAPAIALRWRLRESATAPLVASARIMDGDSVLSSADRKVMDEKGDDTTAWSNGAEATTYFVLPLPLGVPPLAYDLKVVVYAENGEPLTCNSTDGALHIGQIALAEADQREADAYGTWSEANWQQPPVGSIRDGLTLEGFSVRPTSVVPASPIYVTLRWRAARDDLPPVSPILSLRDDEAVRDKAEGELFRDYPATRWRSGDLFIETRQVTMPPTLEPLDLVITTAEDAFVIGKIQVDLSALQWNLPEEATPLCASFANVGTLQGYEWRVEAADGMATLILYWQASERAPSTASYTVFAQLLSPEGQIAAQDDGLPDNGERPTTSWLPGEVIADAHQFPIASPNSPVAPQRIDVGLYDLNTLERVPASDCRGKPFANDAVSIFVPGGN